MRKMLTLASILVASFLIFTAVSSTELNGLAIGDTAPDFELKDAVTGEMVSLADFDNAKGFIVIFTCNTCPYAVLYEDRIQELHENYVSKGYPVVAIMPNDPDVQPGDSMDKMAARAEEKGFTFNYLFDDGQTVYPQYGASRTPHVFLLDAERTVRYIGAIDDNPQDASAVGAKYVEQAIAAMEEGGSPDPDFTKAIGCTIKVKK